MPYINQLHQTLARMNRVSEVDIERFAEACQFHMELAEYDFIWGDDAARQLAAAQKRKALNALYQARELLAYINQQTAA